jgi:hypothetical protein
MCIIRKTVGQFRQATAEGKIYCPPKMEVLGQTGEPAANQAISQFSSCNHNWGQAKHPNCVMLTSLLDVKVQLNVCKT